MVNLYQMSLRRGNRFHYGTFIKIRLVYTGSATPIKKMYPIVKNIFVKSYAIVNIDKVFDSVNPNHAVDQKHPFWRINEKLNQVKSEDHVLIGFTRNGNGFDSEIPVKHIPGPLLNGLPGNQYMYVLRGPFKQWERQNSENLTTNFRANTVIANNPGYVDSIASVYGLPELRIQISKDTVVLRQTTWFRNQQREAWNILEATHIENLKISPTESGL
jgi:hypothetical protein